MNDSYRTDSAPRRRPPRALLRRRRVLVGGAATCAAAITAVTVTVASGEPSKLSVAGQADTYVSTKENSDHGTATSLYVSSLPTNRRTAYIRFVVPAGRSVAKATLVLTRDAHHFPSTTVSAATAGTDWPVPMTSAHRPASGTVLDTEKVESSMKSVSLDVSKAVAGPGTYAFAITSPVTAGAVRFRSREAGGAGVPELSLQLGNSGGGPPVVVPTSTGGSPTTVPATEPPATTSPATTSPATTSPVTTPPATSPVTTKPPVTVPPTTKPPAGGCGVDAKLVPACGVWFGAAPTARDASVPRDKAMADFESRLGQPVDIAHTYHVDDSPFPNDTELAWANDPENPRLLLINWKPTFGHTWAEVAAGAADASIDKIAAQSLARYRGTFFLSIFHEPENDVNPAAGSGFTAQDYKAMYRHVALRLRADGMTNAVLVMNYMGAPKWGVADWFDELYPGDDVVDWVAYDPYATAFAGFYDGTFADMVNRGRSSQWPGMYDWLLKNHPGKPVMLAEWGVAEDAGAPKVKPDFFEQVSSYLPQFPAIKALVYFDTSEATVGDTRTNTTGQSQTAFNRMASQGAFEQTQVP